MGVEIVKLLGSPVQITPNIKGAYSAAVTYVYGDLVSYNGSSYVATGNTLNNLPTNTTYWTQIASKGDAGATGATGSTGATGATGAGVPTGGTTGQVLAKNSNTDYDDGWIDAPTGGGGGVSFILAYSHGGNMANNTTIPWDTQLGGATLSSGAWTCPTTGIYEIIASATFGSNPNSKDLQFSARINGSIVAYGSGTPSGAAVNFQWITTLAVSLAITSGDVLTITCGTGGTLAASSAYYSLKQLA